MIASAGGLLSGFRLFPVEGSQGFTGQLIFRVKMTSATQFESDQLDPSGWSPLYDGAFSWEPGQPFELPGNTAFDYDGKSSLILSLVFAMPAGNYLLGGFEAIDTPAPRFRAGSNTGVNPPPEDWQGNFPPNRSLKSTIPRLELIFIHSPVLAGFQATPLEIPIGGTVQFTDKSLGAVANRWWDFNFDGIVDSLEKNPAHRYSKPGLYTVELRVRNGTTEDAETAWQLIRVLPSSD